MRVNDGFNAWINGTHVADLNVASEEEPFNALALGSHNETGFADHHLPNGGGLLVAGENVLAVQVLNSSVGGSDAFFDAILQANVATAAGPTPGFPNSVFSTDVAPQIRKVAHSPEQPGDGQDVLITALITDPDGVASASLEYQVVRAGGYIRITDAAYDTNWASLPMNDAGAGGDLFAERQHVVGGHPGQPEQAPLFSSAIASWWRMARGTRCAVPYEDDPQPNFAYFCYDGVPAWTGALAPGSPQVTYSAETLTKVPVYHMLAQESDVLGCMYNDPVGSARTYRYYATVVYDGVVYDHIKFRVKGQASTRVTGKNKIKWNFNRGHRFQARDNYGRKYSRKWDKFALQTGTCPWWGLRQFDGRNGSERTGGPTRCTGCWACRRATRTCSICASSTADGRAAARCSRRATSGDSTSPSRNRTGASSTRWDFPTEASTR